MEGFVRGFLESRWRRTVVIFLTFGLGLFATWPAVDQYIAMRQQCAELEAQRLNAQAAAGELDRLNERFDERRAALAARRSRCVSAERLTVFRGRLVELARESNCQLRKVAVGESHRRPWRKGDDPRSPHEAIVAVSPGASPGDAAAGKSLLHTQSVSLAVTGGIDNVRDFLKRLQQFDLLVSVSHVTLQPADDDSSGALLELQCLLFDLAEPIPPQSPPAA